jgi:alginate O-acetyltransferase complex protein AlgI
MLFNSFGFAVFFVVVFALYWLFSYGGARLQNVLLLLAGVFFYGWADYRLLVVLLFSCLFNFFIAVRISAAGEDRPRSLFLWLGVIVNIGILGYFKYFDFFYNSFVQVFGGRTETLGILLPLGISFFTFQAVGYLIDVFNDEMPPSRDLLTFSVYMTYFPKILAGPIEPASRFLPQAESKRVFDYALATDGLRQFLWGLFAKVVVADNCSVVADEVFNNYAGKSGAVLLAGSFFYAFQVYCDFSGYSNMAIGISKLLGIRLMQNFAMPYFSTNISDFWKKWHISLSAWMMKYVFTPMSFLLRKYRKAGLVVAIITTFILVGLWHGANWTFIVFGLMHGLYFVPVLLSNRINQSPIVAKGRFFPNLKEATKMFALFLLVMLTMIVFRVETITDAWHYFARMVSHPVAGDQAWQAPKTVCQTLIIILVFLIVEWLQRESEHGLQLSGSAIAAASIRARAARWSLYTCIILVIFFFQNTNDNFIYFRF